ncbi:MAG: deoxyribonuclease IV [Bacilli bacterium]|nr:deoxyribonuclease IV [Bacilli bacterium]
MKIGSHVGNSGDLMLKGSVLEALSYGENCFMVYMGAPQNTFRKPVHLMNIKDFQEILYGHDINIEDVIVHAPYIVNLGQVDEEKHSFGVKFLTEEVNRIGQCGMRYMVLHPGAYTKATLEQGLNQIVKGVNQILYNTEYSGVTILLETMAGKGTECGKTFEELAYIIDNVIDPSRIGVCLDTCHIHDAGYDLVNDYEGVIQEFDEKIGLQFLKAIHVNDSKNIRGSHKDRHENFGFGFIGFTTLLKVINDERFKDIPKILETPYIPSVKYSDESYAPYKEEIEMIKKGVFDENLKVKILKNNE